MDAPVINIIVTIMIIMYVLKRMQEVSRKGRDITAPPVHRPLYGERETVEDEHDGYPDSQTFEREASFEEEGRTDDFGQRTVQDEFHPETVRRRFEVPDEPPPPRARKTASIHTQGSRRRSGDEDSIEVWPETVLAVQGEDEESRSFDRTVQRPSPSVMESQRAAGKDRHKEPPRGFIPHFGRRELIRGIIMREVLGPPVGMRSE